MLAGYLLLGTEDKSLEGFLEVFVEGDVDHGVDHGVGVGEHVDPEGVSGQLQISQLTAGFGWET